jgi:hypothetical protein
LSETGGSLELVIDESEFAFGYLRFVGPHDGIPETKQTGKHAMKLGATEFSDNATYDYVIVGAGTAGCVLAARLSESPSAGVLPLEAGSSEPLDAMAVPAAWPTLLSTSADWADKTQSYDEWAVAGWGFDELLPFFRRSERTVGRDENLRGTNGRWPPDRPRRRIRSTHAGLAAADELGFDRARDIGSTAVQFALGDAIALAHCAIDGPVVLAAGGWPSTTTTVVRDRPEGTVGSSRHPHRGAPAGVRENLHDHPDFPGNAGNTNNYSSAIGLEPVQRGSHVRTPHNRHGRHFHRFVLARWLPSTISGSFHSANHRAGHPGQYA